MDRPTIFFCREMTEIIHKLQAEMYASLPNAQTTPTAPTAPHMIECSKNPREMTEIIQKLQAEIARAHEEGARLLEATAANGGVDPVVDEEDEEDGEEGITLYN